MPRVIAISGGRLQGNTDQFLQKALDIIAEYHIDTELISLATQHIELDPCSRCPSDCTVRPAVCVTRDDFNSIFKKMV
ncbi:MAG: NAD(P)H-dependent oxidoreductase, partial [Theionarchaea archaeon]|nr:NAD(P)H-dependent oxidoreductase [Theionarchaea archaeon]